MFNFLKIKALLSIAFSVAASTATQVEPRKAAVSKPVMAKPQAVKTAPTAVRTSGSTKPYHAIIAKHAAANGVPVSLAHVVVFSESTYRANARGAAGEIGLMQLRLPTARLAGYKGSAKGLYNPDTNIRYGMKYLGQAHKLASGNTCGTILRYNAGLGAKRMNPISARYCKKVARILR